MYGSILSAVLNIILNNIFIQKYGYIAAGYKALFCYFTQATMDYFSMKKVEGSSIYDMRYLGILSVIVIAISLFSGMTYGYEMLRYAVVVFLVTVALLCRKRIITIFGKLKGGSRH